MFSLSVRPPPCFGNKTVYSNDSPQCVGCAFHNSCREEVIKMVTQAYLPPPSMVQQPIPIGQFYPAAPAPAPYQPVQTQAPQIRPQPWSPPLPPGIRIPVQSAPVQVQAPQPPPQYNAQGPQPAWAPLHFQIPPALPPSTVGYYGYAPDAMWQAVAQVPPMFRPQQPGEGFFARVLKNLLLVLMEHGFQQLVFATRQAFLPPPRPQAPVIEVTPRAP